MKNYVYLIISFIHIVSCGSIDNKKDDTSLINIKIEKPDITSLQPLKLSEIVDSIKYLQLETTSQCLLPYNGVMNTLHIGNNLFLSNLYSIFRFDAITGKFICKIGNRGQGPKEYIQIDNMLIDKDNNRIIIKDGYKKNLIMYNYAGMYLGQINLNDMTDIDYPSCYYSLSLKDIDSRYMIFIAEIMPYEQACQPNEIIVYDYINKKILHTVPNIMSGMYERISTNMNGMRSSTKYDNIFFHKSFYNDTLYAIHKEKGITPYAKIDLGKRKLPNEVFFSKNEYSNISGKIIINAIFINSNYIFIECLLLNDESLKDNDIFICKYNTNTTDLTYHSFFINDIDGGPNVLSINQLTNKLAYIFPFDVIPEKFNKILFSTLNKSELKYPELKDQFEFIQKSRNADDNPLLMILYTK